MKYVLIIFSILIINLSIQSKANDCADKDVSPQFQLATLEKKANLSEKSKDEYERRGCCSHHSGVCGCSSGRAACCDGTLSPSCGCD